MQAGTDASTLTEDENDIVPRNEDDMPLFGNPVRKSLRKRNVVANYFPKQFIGENETGCEEYSEDGYDDDDEYDSMIESESEEETESDGVTESEGDDEDEERLKESDFDKDFENQNFELSESELIEQNGDVADKDRVNAPEDESWYSDTPPSETDSWNSDNANDGSPDDEDYYY
jgi:hypothetical protein